MSFTHECETVELLTMVCDIFLMSFSAPKKRKVASMTKKRAPEKSWLI